MTLPKFRSLFAAVSTLSLLLIVSPASTAVAQHGGDTASVSDTSQASEATDTSGSQSATSDQGSGSSSPTTTETEHQGTAGDGTELESGSLKSRAAQLLSGERSGHQQHSEAQRQNACKQHQGEIDHRFSTLGTQAQKHLTTLNTVFTKLQAYGAAHQGSVSNYDALVSDATAKQAAATTAVSALTALSATTVDCTATDPATVVAGVKTATSDARTALQAYRAALKALVMSLMSAKTTPTTGGNS